MRTTEALRYAQERDLDLVEVAPDAKPPVCRVLDYSKYKYEQAQKQKAARKHQQQITIREIKFRPKIAQHDYDTKKGHVERFLKARDKVKVTIMFRGREVAHPERGEIILNRLAEELGELAVVEQRPTQDGRNMTMMLGPVRTKDDDTHQSGGSSGGGHGKNSRRTREASAAAKPSKSEREASAEAAAPAAPAERPGGAPAAEAPAAEPASAPQVAPETETAVPEAPAAEAPAEEAPAAAAAAPAAPAAPEEQA